MYNKINKLQYEQLKQELSKSGLMIDANQIVSKHIALNDKAPLTSTVRPVAVKPINGDKSLNASQIKALSPYGRHYCENLELNYIILELVR